MNKIIKAARFAERCHAGQCRKYTGAPYVSHCARVAMKVMLLSDATEEMVCAAWLHDTIEDCGITRDDLVVDFGVDVAGLVTELTNVSKVQLPDSNRAERKRADHLRLVSASVEAQNIKCIDRQDNLAEMGKAPAGFRSLYLDESESLAVHLTKAKPALVSELASMIKAMKEGRYPW